jgi:hypothetical protein
VTRQPLEVIRPWFIPSWRKLRVGELEQNVLEVMRKRRTQEALDVLDYDYLWLKLADGAHDFREQIPLVTIPPVLPAQRERLAWRTAAEQIGAAGKRSEVETPNILLE